MRILFLLPERLPTHRADVAILFEKYMPLHGISGTLVGQGSTAIIGNIAGFEVKTSTPHGGRFRRELSFFGLCLRQLWSARVDTYEVIQVRDMVSIGLLAVLVARMRGIPFTYWMSFLMTEGRFMNARTAFNCGNKIRATALWLKATIENQLLYRFILPAATHVFVQSDAMLGYVVKKGIPLEKLTAVPMGVDVDALAPTATTVATSTQEATTLQIGYLGTLDAQRQLGILIEALAEIHKTVPQTTLVFVGDSANPRDLADLRACAHQLGVAQSVEFTGWLPMAEGWQRLRNATACISPFPRGPILDTNSPTKLIEYMALGLPCIGNDNPDQKLVLDESQAGWLVTEHSARAYAEAILQVLNDLPAARRRAAGGPAYVSAHRSYRTLAATVAATYHDITKG